MTEARELQEIFMDSAGHASAQDLLAIRVEAETLVAEIAGVRAATLRARMDLQAALTEERSVRADSQRRVYLARTDVAEAQEEVRQAYAERDAVRAEVSAAQAELTCIQEHRSDRTSWWSLPDWNFF